MPSISGARGIFLGPGAGFLFVCELLQHLIPRHTVTDQPVGEVAQFARHTVVHHAGHRHGPTQRLDLLELVLG